MHIVRVSHERCEEWEKDEYYVIPPSLDVGDALVAIEDAQKKYLEALDKFNKATPPGKRPPTYINEMDDEEMTVKELKIRMAGYEVLQEKYQELRREVAGSFDTHLALFGIVPLDQYKGDGIVNVDLNWGHRHGQSLDY